MAEFAAEVRRLMAGHGISLRGLAKAASYDPSYLSKVLSGHKPSSPYLAARLDDALGAETTVTSGHPSAARTVSDLGTRRLTLCAKQPSK